MRLFVKISDLKLFESRGKKGAGRDWQALHKVGHVAKSRTHTDWNGEEMGKRSRTEGDVKEEDYVSGALREEDKWWVERRRVGCL